MNALFTSCLCAWPKLEPLVGAKGGREEVLDKIELSLSNCTSLIMPQQIYYSFFFSRGRARLPADERTELKRQFRYRQGKEVLLV